MHKLTRRHTPNGHLGDKALEVGNAFYLGFQLLALVGVTEEVFHHIKARVDLRHILEREQQPAAKQARSHGAYRAVYHIEQALAVVAERTEQFEIAHREGVEPHIAVFLYALKGGDMAGAGVLRYVEIMKNGTRSDDGRRHSVDSEALERSGLELAQKSLARRGFGENPVVKLKHQVAAGQSLLEVAALSALHQHLLGRELGEKLVDIVGRTLRGEKFTCGYIQKSHAPLAARYIYGGQEVVLAVLKKIITERHAGSHQFGDSAFHQRFGKFGVFELLTDGDALARAHELGKICVEGVMWKSSKLHRRCRAVGAARKRYTKDFRSRNGIVGKSLVEVAHTKKQHRVGMLFLHLEILLHQRRFSYFLGHRRCFCREVSNFFAGRRIIAGRKFGSRAEIPYFCIIRRTVTGPHF